MLRALLSDGDMDLGQSAIIDYLDATHPELVAPFPRHWAARQGAGAEQRHRLRHPPRQQPAHPALPDRCAGRIGRTKECLVCALGPGRHGGRGRCWRATATAPLLGDAPTLADACLVPQIANAQRMGCDMSAYPSGHGGLRRTATPSRPSSAPRHPASRTSPSRKTRNRIAQFVLAPDTCTISLYLFFSLCTKSANCVGDMGLILEPIVSRRWRTPGCISAAL